MIAEQIARLEKLHNKLIDHRGAYRITASGYTMSTSLYNLADTYDIMRGTHSARITVSTSSIQHLI